MAKARIEVSWPDSIDEASARQAVEFGSLDIRERLSMRHIADATVDLSFKTSSQPRLGVGVFVLHQGLLLMFRRAGAHGAGTWCIPGGHIEYGESPEAAAERETLEETGVVVRGIKRLPYTDDFTPEWTTHYFTLFILAEYVSGQPTVTEPDKCLDVGWVLLESATCRELFLPVQHFLDDNPGILQQLADQKET